MLLLRFLGQVASSGSHTGTLNVTLGWGWLVRSWDHLALGLGLPYNFLIQASLPTIIIIIIIIIIIVGVIDPVVYIYVYIGPGAQSKDIK